MSDNNVRWEPIRGNERLAAVGRIADMLPTGYALCRAVPVTWSQEPPTEAGNWWIWSDDKSWMGTRLARVYREHDGELWIAARYIFRTPLSAMPPDTWYMPAVVPQPPTGEVGE